jgi:protein-S-isoprenylcysteine O-methyltransferase Ste14
MSNLPSLGPRGEGWVAIQMVLFALIAISGLALPGGWAGSASVVTTGTGGLLILAGGALAVVGVLGLQESDALTVVPHPRDDARLATTSIYGLVRHPIYGGLILGALGWALVRASLAAGAGAAVLLVFFELKRRREEAWLEARFPGYVEYRDRTRRFIPWVL